MCPVIRVVFEIDGETTKWFPTRNGSTKWQTTKWLPTRKCYLWHTTKWLPTRIQKMHVGCRRCGPDGKYETHAVGPLFPNGEVKRTYALFQQKTATITKQQALAIRFGNATCPAPPAV
jgi:hypothetical protein